MDRKYLRKVLLVVVVMIIVTILVFSTVRFYFKSPESEIVTRFPVTQSFDESIECQAYVIRNEQVIECDITSKTTLYFFESGEKVSKGSVLAYVYNDASLGGVVKKIYSNRERIEHFESIISAYNTYTLTELNEEIFKLTNKLNSLISSNDTTELEKLENKLSLLIGVRDIKTGSGLTIASCHKYISEISSENEQLVASLGSDYEVITSSSSGYFFRGTDGFENVVTPADLESLSCTQVLELFDKQTSSEGYVGKIVNGYDWYSVCVIPSALIPEFTTGVSYNINITNESNLSVEMTLSDVIYTYGENHAALVFYSEHSPQEFEYSRFQYLEVVYDTYSGYAIPSTAVRYLDGVQGVYILYGYRVEFREITPIYERDGIILDDPSEPATSDYKKLSYYDNIILKGLDLYVDKIID